MARKRKDGLAKFRKRVKAIQRETGKSYSAAQQQASSENKQGTMPKRKTTKRRTVKRTIGTAPKGRTRKKRTVKQQMTGLRDKLSMELGKWEGRMIASTTRKQYNHAGRKVQEIRSQIRKLC